MQRQVLQPDGMLVDGAQPMEEEFLLEALRWMMKSRLYDHRVIGLQRQGQFGVYSPGMGQEASIIGSAMAVDQSTGNIIVVGTTDSIFSEIAVGQLNSAGNFDGGGWSVFRGLWSPHAFGVPYRAVFTGSWAWTESLVAYVGLVASPRRGNRPLRRRHSCQRRRIDQSGAHEPHSRDRRRQPARHR